MLPATLSGRYSKNLQTGARHTTPAPRFRSAANFVTSSVMYLCQSKNANAPAGLVQFVCPVSDQCEAGDYGEKRVTVVLEMCKSELQLKLLLARSRVSSEFQKPCQSLKPDVSQARIVPPDIPLRLTHQNIHPCPTEAGIKTSCCKPILDKESQTTAQPCCNADSYQSMTLTACGVTASAAPCGTSR